MAALTYWLWLTGLRGVGGRQKLALLDHFGDPESVYFADGGEYLLVEGMTRSAAQALAEKSLEQADRILGDCQAMGLRLVTLRDAEYPNRLRNIYDPPLLLYVQGRLPLLTTRWPSPWWAPAPRPSMRSRPLSGWPIS